MKASVPSIACSFFLEQSITPSIQLLEQALFSFASFGEPLSVRFHSVAVSQHIKVPDLLRALVLDELADHTTSWKVYVHLVCRYDPSTTYAPASIAVQLEFAGLRKLTHLVSSLITAGIGEAHPK